jgi:hypothetical protein
MCQEVAVQNQIKNQIKNKVKGEKVDANFLVNSEKV